MSVWGAGALCVFLFVGSGSVKGAAADHQEEAGAYQAVVLVKGPLVPVAHEKVMLPASQGGIIGGFFQSLMLGFENGASVENALYVPQKNPFITVSWTVSWIQIDFSLKNLEPEYVHQLCKFCNDILANKNSFALFRLEWGKQPEDPIDLIDAWERYSGLLLPKKPQPKLK